MRLMKLWEAVLWGAMHDPIFPGWCFYEELSAFTRPIYRGRWGWGLIVFRIEVYIPRIYIPWEWEEGKAYDDINHPPF